MCCTLQCRGSLPTWRRDSRLQGESPWFSLLHHGTCQGRSKAIIKWSTTRGMHTHKISSLLVLMLLYKNKLSSATSYRDYQFQRLCYPEFHSNFIHITWVGQCCPSERSPCRQTRRPWRSSYHHPSFFCTASTCCSGPRYVYRHISIMKMTAHSIRVPGLVHIIIPNVLYSSDRKLGGGWEWIHTACSWPWCSTPNTDPDLVCNNKTPPLISDRRLQKNVVSLIR